MGFAGRGIDRTYLGHGSYPTTVRFGEQLSLDLGRVERLTTVQRLTTLECDCCHDRVSITTGRRDAVCSRCRMGFYRLVK